MTLLLFAILVFVMALVLLGYTFSTFARTQMQAMQLTFFFFLPSILLSGFMFPFHGMPGWAQDVGEILPLTHFLRVVRAVMLKGANLNEVGFELSILGLFVPSTPSCAHPLPPHARLTRERAPCDIVDMADFSACCFWVASLSAIIASKAKQSRLRDSGSRLVWTVSLSLAMTSETIRLQSSML